MKLSRKNWNNYVTRLSAINKTAARKMQAWIDKNGTDNVDALVAYAYALITKYGEAASAAACQMYDEIATIQKANVPPAEPKPTQNIRYVNKAIRSTLDRAPSTVPSTVSEMVKRTGAETTLKNAKRDGAYFAWVPNGDTCAFCITLASNGWRKASKKTINGDHAEHIHKNCDCEFAISFNGPGNIEGYDPDKYLAMYENAEGDTWQEKVNAMRRAQYAANKDAINAQKRAAYANRKGAYKSRGKDITKRYKQNSEPGKGFIEYENGFDRYSRSDEAAMATHLHRILGGDITCLSEKHGQKNPDYEWMGAFWDLKTTSTPKSANSAIKSGMKQIRQNPGGIILDYGEIPIDLEETLRVIDRRMTWYPEECADIMIMSKGEILKILRY